MQKHKETIMKYVFLISAAFSIFAVALICFFLFANGLPAIKEIGFLKFITGDRWKPTAGIYGIMPMILGSVCVTFLSIIMGVPIGILSSVYMAKFCGKKAYSFLKPAVNLLAGIPSVVYGFFGLMVIVPFVRENIGGNGTSMLSASLVLAIMILPTVIGVCESALRAVPQSYYEGSLAWGATKEITIFKVVLPAAKSGVLAGVVLGIGRAIGETMAVIMVAGNQAVMPNGILKGIRTLTANIVLEMGYAQDLHREALIATAVVLFVFILIINLAFNFLKRRMSE